MGPMWGPPGAARTQVGPMLATRTLLSGIPCPVYGELSAITWIKFMTRLLSPAKGRHMIRKKNTHFQLIGPVIAKVMGSAMCGGLLCCPCQSRCTNGYDVAHPWARKILTIVIWGYSANWLLTVTMCAKWRAGGRENERTQTIIKSPFSL